MTIVDLELDELRREFLVEAAAKAQEMQEALEGPRNSASLDRLAYLAHQLKGSGGSYGYQRISTSAAEIEQGAEQLVEGKADDGLEARLQQHAVNLRSEISRCAKELATR